ncbi:MAG: hypothetical protein AAF993_03930 [Pseudomonadota bacterium]
MSSSGYAHALAQLDIIEAAVEAGDLEAAQVAARKLKPLLVSEQVDQLTALKARIDALAIGVQAMQDQDARQLKQMRRQRVGIDAYQTMQGA